MTQDESPATEIRPQDLVPPEERYRFPFATLNQGTGEKRPDFIRPVVWFDVPIITIAAASQAFIHDMLKGPTCRSFYIENNSGTSIRWRADTSSGIAATAGDFLIAAGAWKYSDEVFDFLSIYNAGNSSININDGTATCIRIRLGL